MSHTDKYLKYKNKYLEIKNQVGGGGDEFTKLNARKASWYSFFIAILLFLNNYKKDFTHDVTIFSLLETAGIKTTYIPKSTLNDNIDIYATKIAIKYNIHIYVYETRFKQSSGGKLEITSKDPIKIYGKTDEKGKNITKNPNFTVVLSKLNNIYSLMIDEDPTYAVSG